MVSFQSVQKCFQFVQALSSFAVLQKKQPFFKWPNFKCNFARKNVGRNASDVDRRVSSVNAVVAATWVYYTEVDALLLSRKSNGCRQAWSVFSIYLCPSYSIYVLLNIHFKMGSVFWTEIRVGAKLEE